MNATSGLCVRTNGAVKEAELLLDSDRLDRIVRDEGGHHLTKVAAESAESMLAQQNHNAYGQGFWPMKCQFAEKVCIDIIKNLFFGTARPNLVSEGRFENLEQARQWQRSVEESMHPGIKQMAEQLMKDPSANNLRAPKRTVKVQSTEKLLGEVLVTSPSQDGHGR